MEARDLNVCKKFVIVKNVRDAEYAALKCFTV